jgi:hypothetical protein
MTAPAIFYAVHNNLTVLKAGVVGTLKTGYPRIKSLSQNKEPGVHPYTAT